MKKVSGCFLSIIVILFCAFSFTACINIDNWGEWVLLTAQSCTDDGVQIRISKRDSTIIETRTFATAYGHDWNDWTVTAAPTCIITGTETRVCKHDNKHTQTRVIDALEHDWNDWIMTTPPAVTTDGIETRVCKNDSAHTEMRTAYGTALGTLGLKYTSFNGGTKYSVEIGTAIDDNIFIPAYYNSKPVTEISGSGFAMCENFITVIFAGNSLIETIGNGAFFGCENLAKIILPKTLKTIGQNAFSMCTSLESITIPASVTTIGPNILRYCSKLKTIYVGVTKAEAAERWGAGWGDGEYNTGDGIVPIVYLS